MKVRRTCKSCGDVFGFDYRRGRPRERCFACQPPGLRVVGAVKSVAGSADSRPALKAS